MLPYLLTPPLGQDMTQGQFLSGVLQVSIQSIPSPRLVASPRLKNPVCPAICWHYVSMSVRNRPQHITFFLSITYTPSFITITYKSYNVNRVHITIKIKQGCPHGVMVKAMDCGIVVREFVLQSRCYVHFRANTLGKGMNPLILPAIG